MLSNLDFAIFSVYWMQIYKKISIFCAVFHKKKYNGLLFVVHTNSDKRASLDSKTI